ncbi:MULTISPECIES: hypothetical protein [unclassified Streptomyces]|uniref:hypothetical protein n=1 Tax=unclassified Streptomyces TaxID=2593676 RepID=UPI00307734C2
MQAPAAGSSGAMDAVGTTLSAEGDVRVRGASDNGSASQPTTAANKTMRYTP